MKSVLTIDEYKSLLKKQHKYGAVRTHGFASKAEFRRSQQLELFRKAGAIKNLKFQPRFHIYVEGVKVCDYVADFEYQDERGRWIVEEVKGVETPVYKLKKKLFLILYPDYIFKEIKAKDI